MAAGAASLLVNTAPIFTAVIAVAMMGDRLRPIAWLGMGLSFTGAGAIAFSGEDGIRFSAGAILILGAAVCHSLHFTLQRRYLTRYTAIEFTTYSLIAATGAMLVVAPGLPGAVRAAPLEATLAVAYLGVFPAALGYVSWAYVLARLPVARAASFLYLVPAFAFLISWFWLGEKPTVLALGGGVLALTGVIIVNTRGRI